MRVCFKSLFFQLGTKQEGGRGGGGPNALPKVHMIVLQLAEDPAK